LHEGGALPHPHHPIDVAIAHPEVIRASEPRLLGRPQAIRATDDVVDVHLRFIASVDSTQALFAGLLGQERAFD
jgi:hypothetical protein